MYYVVPEYTAKLLAVTKRDGTPYSDDDHHQNVVKEKGVILFDTHVPLNMITKALFDPDAVLGGKVDKYWVYEGKNKITFFYPLDQMKYWWRTAPVVEIKENLPSLIFVTWNSIYEFEVIEKRPNIDTSDFFRYFCVEDRLK